MKTTLRAALTAFLAAAVVLPAAAGGTPKPPYEVSCTTGLSGQTTASWRHAKVAEVTFDWTAPGATFTPETAVTSPTPPHGVATWDTPSSGSVVPASVTVDFRSSDGTTLAGATVDCTPA